MSQSGRKYLPHMYLIPYAPQGIQRTNGNNEGKSKHSRKRREAGLPSGLCYEQQALSYLGRPRTWSEVSGIFPLTDGKLGHASSFSFSVFENDSGVGGISCPHFGAAGAHRRDSLSGRQRRLWGRM